MSGTRRSRLRDWPYALIGVVIVAAIAWIAISFTTGSGGGASGTPSIPISNGTANLLEVNPLLALKTVAPAFTLTDQNGKRTSLSDFSGHAVVLTFGDDKCTDLCTLLAEDVLAADKDLGAPAKGVEFVSINANTFYPSVSATKAWTDENGLRGTANWHFLTGSKATLTRLAKTYGVDVELDHKDRTIVHGTDMFFLDPTGNEVEIGQFGVESANTSLFAHAMAQLAVDTLPSSERHHVGGPSASSGTQTSTALGATPAPIELPQVGSGPPMTTAADRGKYVVLNFWSSSCAICTVELPALEKAHVDGDPGSVILGIDVSDPANTATAFMQRAGITYPVLSDSSGIAAGEYQTPGLPYTVILNPKGTVVVRHPGAITTEQLEYLLQTLEAQDPNG